MSELWCDRQRKAWTAFLESVQERAQRELEVRTSFEQRTADIEKEYQYELGNHETDSQASLVEWETKKIDTLDALRNKYEAAITKGKDDYQATKQAAADEYAAARAQLEADFKESRWTVSTVREADSKNSLDQLQQQQQEAANQVAKVEANRKKAIESLAAWTLEVDDQAPPPNKPKHEDAWQELQSHVDASTHLLEEMRTYSLPKQILGPRPFLFMIGAWLVLSCGAFLAGSFWWAVLLAVPAIVFPVGLAIRKGLFRKMALKAEELWLGMEQASADVKVAKNSASEQAKRDFNGRSKQIKEQHDASIEAITA